MTQREFRPSEHFTNLKGKDYLGARWRLIWLRSEHPDWTVSTRIVEGSMAEGYVVVQTTILDEAGRVIADAMKSEERKDFYDFVEKAETGAIGRACAVAGYGTENAEDLDEGTVADAPVEPRTSHGPAVRGVPPGAAAAGGSRPGGRDLTTPSGPLVEPEEVAAAFGGPAGATETAVAPDPGAATHEDAQRARAGGERMTTRELFAAMENQNVSVETAARASKKLWGTGSLRNLDDEQRAVVWAEVAR